jgi:hypothetical protein
MITVGSLKLTMRLAGEWWVGTGGGEVGLGQRHSVAHYMEPNDLITTGCRAFDLFLRRVKLCQRGNGYQGLLTGYIVCMNSTTQSLR